MSEMQEQVKAFKIIKTVPGDVFFRLSPLSNQALVKDIYLTDRLPQQVLPMDWALGIFLDNSLYAMYKNGYFTFSDTAALTKAAIENGVYFDEILDFTPAKPDRTKEIAEILKSGVRSKIENAVKTYGADMVKAVAISQVANLTQGVISMLEQMFNVQLTMDGQ